MIGSKNASHNMAYLYEACDWISDFCHQCDEKYLGTDRVKTVYPPPVERWYNYDRVIWATRTTWATLMTTVVTSHAAVLEKKSEFFSQSKISQLEFKTVLNVITFLKESPKRTFLVSQVTWHAVILRKKSITSLSYQSLRQ